MYIFENLTFRGKSEPIFTIFSNYHVRNFDKTVGFQNNSLLLAMSDQRSCCERGTTLVAAISVILFFFAQFFSPFTFLKDGSARTKKLISKSWQEH